MMKETVKIQFNEKEIKELICQKYNLDPDIATMHVNHYDASNDPRKQSSTTITVEAER